uniref:Putative carboxypeptidase n subunit 2 n=2 Tax=Nyssomyia neivai TaxID=330878 RepID=A0A1L8DR36_9DIPT
MTLLGAVLLLFLMINKNLGQGIQDKNIHCDERSPITTMGEEDYEYDDAWNGKEIRTRQVIVIQGYYCKVRNYEIFSDRDYYVNQSDMVVNLEIEISILNGLPLKLFGYLTSLERFIVTNTTLQHVDQIEFRKLFLINFSDNHIISLDKNAFSECPKLIYVNLSYNNIAILSGPFFDSQQKIGTLDLSYNQITDITEETFNDFHLNFLSLSNNLLEEINLNRFSKLINLRTLDLSGNRLKVLETSGGNFIVDNLCLDFNELTSLNLAQSNIRVISSFSNKLQCVVIGINCRSIDFGINEITDLSLIDSVDTLNYVNLDFNKLGNNLQDICKCTNLVALFLVSNGIDNLGSCLSQMVFLDKLSLEGNNIYAINHDNFPTKNRITHLDLSFNRLETLDGYAMSIFSDLRSLCLAGNQIFDFYDNPKELMPQLERIGLSHNKFKCSKLYILLKKFKAQNLELYLDDSLPYNTTNIGGIQCFHSHEGELLKNIDSTDILCAIFDDEFKYLFEKLNKVENEVNKMSSLLKTVQEG